MGRSPGSHLPSFTSLRWFAASAVFLSHVSASSPERRCRAWAIFGPQGAVGVSFFFILSGFVLGWADRPGDTWRAFYRRRVARIVPAYLVACLAGLVVAVGRAVERPAEACSESPPVTLLQSWSADPYTYYAGNSVSWSLSVEVFFYALFPFFSDRSCASSRGGLLRLLAASVAFAIVWPLVLSPSHQDTGLGFWAIYINPIYRLAEFVAGIALAGLLRAGVRIRVPVAVAMLLAAEAYVLVNAVPMYASRVAVTIIPFCLLIFVCARPICPVSGRGCAIRRLIKLGQWSFAFYLVHQLAPTRARDPRPRPAGQPSGRLRSRCSGTARRRPSPTRSSVSSRSRGSGASGRGRRVALPATRLPPSL